VLDLSLLPPTIPEDHGYDAKKGTQLKVLFRYTCIANEFKLLES
jgi:hypothetical protein